jgi:EmrB/QacA subfamily drug resistance transporter
MPDRDRSVENVAATPTVTSDGTVGLRYASAQGRWVLLATVLGSAMASIDATVVGIALPAIGHDFHANLSTLQWVVTAYTLTLAGLLLLSGALGDRYGRKRLFLIGVAWFAVASLICGIAPNAPILIIARAVQGVGAALLTPGSLAILQGSFREQDRSKAIGAWTGFAGIGTAIGPFLGGWLIAVVSWRLIFFINLPVAAAVLVVGLRHVPESRDPQETGQLDIAGAVLVTVGLIGLTFGLINGPSGGWTAPDTLVMLLVGVALLIGFVFWERRASMPLLPLGLFSSAQFSSANVVTFAVYAALSGTLFLLPIQLEQVSHYSALEAGVSLLPVTFIMLLLSARSGALAARIGPRLQMSVGPVVIGAGLFLFARVGSSGNYFSEVLPAVLVFGFGLAINVAPLTSTVLAAAPAERAGIASAVNNDVARAAGLLAVAILPAAAGLSQSSYLNPHEFSAGFHRASFISAGLCVLAGALAAATIHNPRRAKAADEAASFHCALDGPPQPCPAKHAPAISGQAEKT